MQLFYLQMITWFLSFNASLIQQSISSASVCDEWQTILLIKQRQSEWVSWTASCKSATSVWLCNQIQMTVHKVLLAHLASLSAQIMSLWIYCVALKTYASLRHEKKASNSDNPTSSLLYVACLLFFGPFAFIGPHLSLFGTLPSFVPPTP